MRLQEISLMCKRENGKGVKETIIDYRDNGFSQQFIADSLGVTTLTVRRWCKLFGITFDRKNYNAICKGGTTGKTWICRT